LDWSTGCGGCVALPVSTLDQPTSASVGLVGALSELQPGELGLFQGLFQSVKKNWSENMVRSVTDAEGKPFFVNMPELTAAAEEKARQPLHAAVVRIAVKSPSREGALETARNLAGSLSIFSHPESNELNPQVWGATNNRPFAATDL
jgi:hypothetical protein